MESRVRGNSHARFGVGENSEVNSLKDYLSLYSILYHMLCGKARKSAANFFTLDDLRLLRDFPKGGSLRFYVRKKKKGLRPFRLIKSTCGWGLLLRGGAH